MSDWWSYRLSDFLLFAPRTYYRLFELAHADLWPAQIAAGLCGAACVALAWQGGAAAQRTLLALLALAWAGVAAGFLWRHYAGIHWMAPWFAAGFGLQALMLAAHALRGRGGGAPAARRAGLALALGALAWPLLAPALGRPWAQAELFALMPDPTAVGTLGLLLCLPPGRALLWPLPLAWCGFTGATLWSMGSPDAALAPAAALVALGLALRTRLRR